MSSNYHLIKNPQEKITENLRRYEVACFCCGVVFYEQIFVDYLQILRTMMGIPFEYDPEGGFYRCPKYQKIVSPDNPNSFHPKGLAADIKKRNWNGNQEYEFVRCAQFLGFSIIIYSAHFHIDLRSGTKILRYGTY